MTTKSRKFTVDSGTGFTRAYNGAILASTLASPISLSGYQLTISEGHKWPLRKGAKYDSGGGFTTKKVTYEGEPWRGKIGHKPSPGTWYTYEGPIYAHTSSDALDAGDISISASSNSQLDAFGTRAIAAVAPTNPSVNMANFLGEMKDLPTIPRIKEWRTIAHNFRKGYASKRAISQKAASEWLNQQFGWIPFVSELYKFGLTVKNAEKIMQQFDRDSGRPVRRRYSLPSTSTTNVINQPDSYGNPVMVTPICLSPGKVTWSITITTKRWFSGCFTYYVPPSGVGGWSETRRARQLAAKLFGLRVTPDLVWSLAPWSWAVDWVSNTGSVIKNYSLFSNDNLVMRYGYVMETIERRNDISLSNARFVGGVVSSTQSLVTTIKTRRKATPYGFGLNESQFTAKQWSIIGALGITRIPRSLAF